MWALFYVRTHTIYAISKFSTRSTLTINYNYVSMRVGIGDAFRPPLFGRCFSKIFIVKVKIKIQASGTWV